MNPPVPEALDPSVAAELLRAAREAHRHAYAPYSRFPVGAALLDAEGRVFTGVNVENAAYGLGSCAERSAVTRAMGEGARAFRAIAVAGPEDDFQCTPCGSCRQILHEVAPDLQVVLAGEEGSPRVVSLRALLPEPFAADRLRRRHAPQR